MARQLACDLQRGEETMSDRWHFVLVEEVSSLPVRWQPPQQIEHKTSPRPPTSVTALLRAVQTLLRRGTGPQAWVASYEDDPVAFLLDAIDAPVRLWSGDGRVLYENAAAEQPKWRTVSAPSAPAASSRTVVGRETVYRRVLRFEHAGERYILEVLSPGAQK